MDDNNGKTLNGKVYAELAAEEPQAPTSSVENNESQAEESYEENEPELETAEGELDSESEDNLETEDAEDDSEPQKRDRSVKGRINGLTAERNEEREKRLAAEKRLGELLGNGREEDISLELPNLTQLNPGEEITADQYQSHVAQTAQAMVKIELQRERNANRIEREITGAINEYKELDPKSDTFDEDLSDSITESVAVYLKVNPTGSVKGHIEKLMRPYKRSVERAVGRQTETVTKQVSQTAMRPTQTVQSGKKFAELSIEEMEKRLGKVY